MNDFNDHLLRVRRFQPIKYKIVQRTSLLPIIKYVSRETWLKQVNDKFANIVSIEQKANTFIVTLAQPFLDDQSRFPNLFHY